MNEQQIIMCMNCAKKKKIRERKKQIKFIYFNLNFLFINYKVVGNTLCGFFTLYTQTIVKQFLNRMKIIHDFHIFS